MSVQASYARAPAGDQLQQLELRQQMIDHESLQLINQQKRKIAQISEEMQRQQVDTDRNLVALELKLNQTNSKAQMLEQQLAKSVA